MRIFVTGGTGFVGSHTVAALVRAGHDVRLLARKPERVAAALAPFGVDAPEYAIGDVTDREAVAAGMAGCDAVLHAASVYSLDVRRARETREVNVNGTRLVLEAAADAGIDPIVYVSSLVAFFPPNGRVLTAESPLGEPEGAYYRSKADAERVARELQARGVPIATGYPSGAFGPNDPHFGESAQTVVNIVKRRLPVVPRGGLSIVDVRDVAGALAAMLEAGRGPRRYVLSGTNVPFGTLVETLADVTGRRIPHLALPAPVLRPAVRAAGRLQRVLPFRLPLNDEGFDTIAWNPRGDDSRARDELGFAPRPLRETLADTVAWLHRAGHLSAREAGRGA